MPATTRAAFSATAGRRRTASLPSHWLANPGIAAPTAADGLPASADVVVIGGGVIGVATTYWLARRGVDVVLLEARRLAWGATGRNAGLMLAASNALEDLASIHTLLHDESIDAEFEQSGHLALASSVSIWNRIQDEVARRPSTASPLHALDRPQCEALLGLRIAPWIPGGRWLPAGAAIHPVRFVLELAERAHRRGARFVYPVVVHRIDDDGVVTTRGIVRARDVIVACGSRTPRLVRPTRAILHAHRATVCSTQPIPRVFYPGLAIDWGAYYWRQASDGTIVIGGGVAESNLLATLASVFPDLPPLEVARRWTGTMEDASDGRPLVGRWSPRLWIAAGFGGHGLPPALGVGAALADSIATAQPSLLLERFDPARFAR